MFLYQVTNLSVIAQMYLFIDIQSHVTPIVESHCYCSMLLSSSGAVLYYHCSADTCVD